MIFTVHIDTKVVNVTLINKKHIKHCYLRVVKPNLLQIKAHSYFDIIDAKELINKKINWIKKSIESLENNSLNQNEFRYLGEIKVQDENGIKNLDIFYKTKAQEIIPKIIDEYSQKMKLYPTSVKYRKNKRTWGSCNYKNGLNFNIYLMKFPLEIIVYVVIHELCHIKYKNHSKEFWILVEKYCPDYKQIEKKFKSFL